MQETKASARPNPHRGTCAVLTCQASVIVSTRPRPATFRGDHALHFARSWRFFQAGATNRTPTPSNRHEMRLLTTRRIFRLVQFPLLPLRSAMLFVARAALVPIFAIVGLLPVDAISTSGGCSHSAVPQEVTSYAADNRAFNAAACLRITWESERHDGNTEKARNQKRFFHEFLLVQAL